MFVENRGTPEGECHVLGSPSHLKSLPHPVGRVTVAWEVRSAVQDAWEAIVRILRGRRLCHFTLRLTRSSSLSVVAGDGE